MNLFIIGIIVGLILFGGGMVAGLVVGYQIYYEERETDCDEDNMNEIDYFERW